ncbi:hypothetical protein RB195_023752 [Necator americanus]|uniref:Uncharacterized protein n=1 Tax=Necator americanus TaxID=51031 RepID=A0ABR1EKF2_NECAM
MAAKKTSLIIDCSFLSAAAPTLQNRPDELYSLIMQQPAQVVFPVAAPCYGNPSQQGSSAVGTHTFRGEKCDPRGRMYSNITKKQREKTLLSTAALDVNNKRENSHRHNPDDALWLSEDHSDTSRDAIEEEFICRTLKPRTQMKLPRFWGDEEEFPKFWAVYESLVHQNKVLSTVEKILLFKDSLRGRTEMSIKAIELIPENYKWIVETIKKEYGKKPINRAKIAQKLIDLPSAKNNAENCPYIFDKIRMLVNQIVSAGQDIPNTEDAMWTGRILEKFPYNIVKNVLISIQEMEDVKVENVMEQLEKEINAKKNCRIKIKRSF